MHTAIGWDEGDGSGSGDNTAGFIDITVETNINKLFFKYDIKDWCLSVTGSLVKGTDNDISVSRIVVPVKDFKCTNNFVYKDFLTLIKAEQYPYLEIAIPQHPELIYSSDSFVLLKDVSITVAGVSRKYDIPCYVDKQADGNRILYGKALLNLTDLKIDPPVKFAGLVKVRDEIIVKFGFCISKDGAFAINN